MVVVFKYPELKYTQHINHDKNKRTYIIYIGVSIMKNRKKFWQKIHVGLLGIIFLLVGILILVILHIIDVSINQELVQQLTDSNLIEYIKRLHTNSSYYSIVQPILYNMAISLIVLGCGSLLLELYGYASYFRKRLFEVFVEKDALAILNEEYKKKLKLNLIESLYSPNTSDSQEILTLFDSKLPDLLNSVYFSFVKITADISIFQNTYIKKHFFRTIEIKEIDTNKTNVIKTLFCITCEDISGVEVFKLHKITDGNGNELLGDSPQGNRVGNKIQYVCSLKDELEIHGSATLEIEYTTIVPVEDTSFTLKIDKLCKQFNFSLSYDPKQIDTAINLFYFDTYKKRYLSQKLESYNSITYSDWLLPGEGVSCHIKKIT